MINPRDLLRIVLLAATVAALGAGCAVPRAIGKTTKGVVKGTAKAVNTTTKVVTKPLR